MKFAKKLLATLAAVLTLSTVPFTGCTDTVNYEVYDNAQYYQVGSASISATQVRELDVDWIGGSIEIVQSENEEVQVIEESNFELDSERMHYRLEGDVLKVKYCESGLRSTIDSQKKNLRIALPANISVEIECVDAVVTAVGERLNVKDFSWESVSGNFTAEIIECQEVLDLETVSGKMLIGELFAPKLSVESVSGAFSVTKLSAVNLEADTVSSKMEFGLQQALTADVESTSGEIIFTMLGEWGTTLRYKTVSGAFHCEKEYTKVDKLYQIGTGTACSLQVSTTSADLRIK